jgi:hypothetical protein
VFGYVFDDVVWNVQDPSRPARKVRPRLAACLPSNSIRSVSSSLEPGQFLLRDRPYLPLVSSLLTHFMGQCTNSFQRSAITSIKMNSNNTANIIELATDLPLFCRGLQHFHLSVICLWASDCEKMGDTCKALVESLRSSYPGSEITVSIRHEDLSEFPLGHTGLGSSRHNRGRPPPRHRV